MGDIFGAIGGVAGAAIGAQANKDVAKSQIQAGREQRDFDLSNLNVGMARQLALFYGPDKAESILRATLPRDQVDRLIGRSKDPAAQRANADEIAQIDASLAKYSKSGLYGGGKAGVNATPVVRYDKAAAKQAGVDIDSLLARRKDLANNAEVPGQLDLEAYRTLGPGILGQYDQLTDQATRESGQALNAWDLDTNRLLGQSREIERQAQNFGESERTRINRDADRSLKGVNRLTEARLMARGLGASSVLGNQLASNARSNLEGRQDALGQLGDRQIQLRTGLMGNTLGLDTQRSGGRQSLLLGGQDRAAGFRQQALGLNTNLLSGGGLNPWLARSTGSYFSGASPSGAAGQTWGNALSALGGYTGGRQSSVDWNSLFRGSGQSSGGSATPTHYSNYNGQRIPDFMNPTTGG